MVILCLNVANLNKYDKCLINLMIYQYKEEVDNFYIKSIVNTLFKNGDVKLDNVFSINYIIFL